jgi:PAP_fibrillin
MLSKHDLRNAIAPTNRGIAATDSDRQAIASIIARIEDLNPTPQPLSAPALLAGDWRLLYTTSQELLGIDRVPLAQLGDIYQCVRLAGQQGSSKPTSKPTSNLIYNIAEIKGLPYLDSLVSVVASFEPAQAEVGDSLSLSGLSQRRVNVKFNRGVIGLQRVLGYQSPAQYIEKLEAAEKIGFLQGFDFPINSTRQQGWLEITYLDEDLRISRGNQGSLFVLTK